MSWKIWNYLRHHEQWFMNCLVRQFCLFTEISSIYNNKQTQSLLIFELQAKQGLRSNHIFTIESFWQNHPTYLIIFKYSSVPTEGMKILGIPTGLFIIEIWVVEVSNGGYKIRKIFAKESTNPKEIIEKVPKFDFQNLKIKFWWFLGHSCSNYCNANKSKVFGGIHFMAKLFWH